MLKQNGLYYMYLRKSREDLDAEKHGSGETLARHETQLFETAARLNIRITGIYREVVSGETIAARPEMLRLLNDIELYHPDGVLVTEIPRLARGDTRDQGLVMETFKYAGTYIITPMKIYNPNDEFDEEYAEFGLFMSRREYASIKRRLANGKMASVKEGKFAGTRVAYGYERYKLPDEKGFSLRILPEQAQIVRMIYQMYLNGTPETGHKPVGPAAISQILNNMQIPTQTGKTWLPGVIRGMLANGVYAGYVHWGKRKTVKVLKDGYLQKSHPTQQDYLIAPGRHQPIIEPADWEKAQLVLSQRSKRPAFLDSGLQNALAGILYCSECHRLMTRRPAGKQDRADWILCKTKDCPTCGCDYALVEHRIIEALEIWLKDEKFMEPPPAEDAEVISQNLLHTALTARKAQIAALIRQQERICTLLETDIYSEELFSQRQHALSEQIQEAQSRLQELEATLAADGLSANPRPLPITNSTDLFHHYWKLCPEDKNALLREFVCRVEYHKLTRGTRQKPSSFQLTIYPRL